ncbi:MAG TPA: protein kinase [Sphingomicrobium sp.]|nr:protein kinase [Sphingomicrobium sp.]
MSKAFSNKALPAGTVLREWRLEEVLGVGGFGIVYKARGIYFDELVAIKEYFPSSISDRNAEDTVVPIDSDAEEVHALGLKKFVEEAKLLWNLSTPTRHPNIVSVRSLFEIHGTAYIVMDFEDGISLSKMLRQGRRFNERSLWGILRPIAEGLDRAHRVGVLHRDIKPPNILINEDNRPVLIDFGSARFTTAEATSTTVTFHTPPYAAIEQYVRTYDQGPWTDIYALGVVMYECVTGEKPAEVLERLHAGLGTPLGAGKWPGYGKKFLAAIDVAMTIKPDERPQSITEWLEMFGKPLEADEDSEDVDESTHFYSQQVTSEEIVPVATAPGGFEKTVVETDVPTDPKQAQFKRLGEDTNKTHKRGASGDASEAGKAGEGKKGTSGKADAVAAADATDKAASKTADQSTAEKPARKISPILVGAAAVGLLVIGGSTVILLRGSGPQANTAAASSQHTAAAQAVTDPGLAPNPVLDAAQNTAAPAGAEQAVVPSDADAQLRKESAKTAAAEAQLAQMKRAADKAAKLQTAKTAATPAPGKPGEKTAAATSAASSSSSGVSPAKVAQLNAIVDEGRAMAKQVMRSGNSQNAQLARNYDSYLKTAKDSMRGVSSDKEADRLIKQASQTRAYIQFLVKQSR